MSSVDPTLSGVTGLPFDDVKAILTHFPEPDTCAANHARQRLAARAAAGPRLGLVEDLAVWLAGWRGDRPRKIERAQLALFASVMPPFNTQDDIARAMETLELTAAGGHPASAMCYRHGVGLKVYDLALDVPSGDIRAEASLSEEDCAATMAFGMEAVAGGLDLVALGRFGRGGDTAAAALAALLHPERADEVLAAAPEGERAILAPAIERHNSAGRDPFELLRRVGTRDMAAIVGAILAARTERVPVLLDGAPAIAAAAVLHAASPDNVAHCRIATVSSPLERILADILGLAPLVDFPGETAPGGEGVGALIAFPLMQSASDILETAVSREQAGLSAA